VKIATQNSKTVDYIISIRIFDCMKLFIGQPYDTKKRHPGIGKWGRIAG